MSFTNGDIARIPIIEMQSSLIDSLVQQNISISKQDWGRSRIKGGRHMEILIPILAVTVIGLICAVGLAVASSAMAVKEDTRFTEIRACLPGANCGACGYTGCDGYAKALLEPGTKTKRVTMCLEMCITQLMCLFLHMNSGRLSWVAGGALYPVPNADEVKKANVEGAIDAATVDDTLYAYPMTADNGYFLYYNKKYLSDSDVKTLDGILKVSRKNHKKFMYGIRYLLAFKICFSEYRTGFRCQ